MNREHLKTDDIEHGLRALGLGPGMRVVTHSSLRSFGRVEGGAQTVITALMNVVTPAGLLLFPSFNHGVPFEASGPGHFHPNQTPTINGAIPDAFWRLPGVRRSLDPTHPIAAWGADAERYVAAHHRTLTMGPRSPLGLLLADGGHGLLLGVDYTFNTFHHVVETTLRTPCLGSRSEAYPVQLADGRRITGRTWGWRNAACPITDENRYGALMRDRGLDRVENIGPCRATFFKLSDCFSVVADLLRNGHAGFPPCHACAVRPRMVAQTVPSDWDASTQVPTPDATCWTY